jgi:NAD(P)H-dependent FMN reductase
MAQLQVVTVSTRPTRKGPAVAQWFAALAQGHGAFEVVPVDLAAVALPLYDEPEHPRFRRYEHDHTKRWSALVDRADAFAFVTPEYNHSAPPSLTNALDYLFHEWAYKPVAFVSYGGVAGGTRSVQAARVTVTALRMMPIPEGVHVPFFTKSIGDDGVFSPDVGLSASVKPVLDELARWEAALRPLRRPG